MFHRVKCDKDDSSSEALIRSSKISRNSYLDLFRLIHFCKNILILSRGPVLLNNRPLSQAHYKRKETTSSLLQSHLEKIVTTIPCGRRVQCADCPWQHHSAHNEPAGHFTRQHQQQQQHDLNSEQ
jgi:hypothetical protein